MDALIAVLREKHCNAHNMSSLLERKNKLLVLLVLAILFSGAAEAQSWALPTLISDANAKITFTVDSTWHTIHGTTSQLTGTISQTKSSDPLSVAVDVSIPVSSFNTRGESRDQRLQEVMNSHHYPAVRFSSSHLSPSCHPLRVAQNRVCDGSLEGTLTIRDVSQPVSLPIHIQLEADHYDMLGSLSINWSDYHVEDPSILIAKLAPTVTINYSIRIPKLSKP